MTEEEFFRLCQDHLKIKYDMHDNTVNLYFWSEEHNTMCYIDGDDLPESLEND